VPCAERCGLPVHRLRGNQALIHGRCELRQVNTPRAASVPVPHRLRELGEAALHAAATRRPCQSRKRRERGKSARTAPRTHHIKRTPSPLALADRSRRCRQSTRRNEGQYQPQEQQRSDSDLQPQALQAARRAVLQHLAGGQLHRARQLDKEGGSVQSA
jgi:hypothetical protein